MGRPDEVRDVVNNRKARFEYSIDLTMEAGLSLLGSEVKSLRGGRANLQDAHIRIEGHEAWLLGCHISPYSEANRFNHDPTRARRLLLHAHEILKLRQRTRERGFTVIPLRLYFKGSLVKVEIALAKGKKLHDKRESIKARDVERELRRVR
jgi:SsrA-binding protein